MLNGFDGDFQGEGVGSGAAMAFKNFGHVDDGPGEAGEDVADDADANEGGDGQADFGGIQLRAEASDDSGVFHFADTLGDGGQGEADATSEFGERDAAIVLEFLKNMPASLVEGQCIESHIAILL